MNRSTIPVFLQDQHAWTLWVFRIIFYNDGICDPLYDISHKNLICGQFIITMIGYSDLSAFDQNSEHE